MGKTRRLQSRSRRAGSGTPRRCRPGSSARSGSPGRWLRRRQSSGSSPSGWRRPRSFPGGRGAAAAKTARPATNTRKAPPPQPLDDGKRVGLQQEQPAVSQRPVGFGQDAPGVGGAKDVELAIDEHGQAKAAAVLGGADVLVHVGAREALRLPPARRRRQWTPANSRCPRTRGPAGRVGWSRGRVRSPGPGSAPDVRPAGGGESRPRAGRWSRSGGWRRRGPATGARGASAG